MVRISDKKVKEEILLHISDKLIEQVAKVKTKKSAQNFLAELLTETERIMLAKRFAIIVMIDREYSFSTIIRTLKVSQSTIARIVGDKKEGKFDFLLRQTRQPSLASKAKKGFDFWLEMMMQAELPPRGKGRWRGVHRLMDAQQERQERKVRRQKGHRKAR